MTTDIPDADAAPARNLELKAEVTPGKCAAIREELAQAKVDMHERLLHDDTYFTAPAGRLKLRMIHGAGVPPRAELIGYRRGDVAGSRWSDYQIMPLTPGQAPALAAVLGQAMDVWVRVRKCRDIYLVGVTRVHLDDVDQLGTFVELETVVTNQSLAEAEREHDQVIALLDLGGLPVIAGSYSDLLAQRLAAANDGQ